MNASMRPVRKTSVDLASVSSRNTRLPESLGESSLWQSVGATWRQLHGSFARLGVSFEWHDFECGEEFDWSRSFHPGSLEICLNLSGEGVVSSGSERIEIVPETASFYCQRDLKLTATRRAGERHQFITVEFSLEFLAQHLAGRSEGLHPLIRSLVEGRSKLVGVGSILRMTGEQRSLISSLQRPPVFLSAQELWYHSKALEIAASVLYQPPPEEELFCMRQKRLAQERVARVVALLKSNLAEPPSLEEIGRAAGCSPFYLSRTFTKEMGMTISQYLRQLRMDRAAELLRSGKFNVTEAALEVGYLSLSHFSQAFHETFGCCPGLYPMATPTQKAAARERSFDQST
ncbi:MAG: helix-turn-helix transcriptional regulator [Verrucomicrobia bacterium]|nr:helix-turn-helix transcriptional regulator [Verrucomicrobiota bacterium]